MYTELSYLKIQKCIGISQTLYSMFMDVVKEEQFNDIKIIEKRQSHNFNLYVDCGDNRTPIDYNAPNWRMQMYNREPIKCMTIPILSVNMNNASGVSVINRNYRDSFHFCVTLNFAPHNIPENWIFDENTFKTNVRLAIKNEIKQLKIK